MASEADIRERIETINTILAGGVVVDESDGQKTQLNHDTLRAERTRLERQLGTGEGAEPMVFRFGAGNG